MVTTEALWRQHGVVMRAAIDLASSVPEIDTLWNDTPDIFVGAIAEILRLRPLRHAGPATTTPLKLSEINTLDGLEDQPRR